MIIMRQIFNEFKDVDRIPYSIDYRTFPFFQIDNINQVYNDLRDKMNELKNAIVI